MSDSKYYTPSIEEFHNGFEYEWNYKGEGWKKDSHSFGTSMDENAGDWYEFSPENPKTEVRVKYLDREDIESFGWIEKEGLEEPFTFTIQYDDILVAYLHFYDEDGEIRVIIDCGDKKFSGILKNKSQLKQILQWTGILK